MTVPELILNLMDALRARFYAGRPEQFARDYRGLRFALCKWGALCGQRGWDFTPEFVHGEIMGILRSIQKADKPIEYLPVYLRSAIARHVGEHAEELNAESKRNRVREAAAALVRTIKPGEVRAPTTNEMLIALNLEMKRLRIARKSEQVRPAKRSEQKELL